MAKVLKRKYENIDDFIKVSTNSFLIDRLIAKDLLSPKLSFILN